ncbi:MAG TPA: NADH-quinone oxidoreductase subunit N, partial [Gammaproteobacteria bacterium]|nr:NADH-quinone oxidoreductase subunit N [Gammaproteobacteria bacterium]
SLLYGITGSIDFIAVAKGLHTIEGNTLTLALFGLVFIVGALGFKFGVVPFHMWIPDVYQGAPTPVTLLVGTAPKIAAFGMAYRLLAQGMPDLSEAWIQLLTLLAILSLALGNLLAISQTNIKRLLAYSTIAHAGFLMLGFLVGPEEGYLAAMNYAIIYALVAAGAFGTIILLSYKGFEAENIEDFKGLAAKSPWIAFLMMILLFSLAGVPPTAGFYAKFLVLSGLVGVGKVWLALLAVFFTIIGAFYYIRVIKVMYFDDPIDGVPVVFPFDMRVVLSLNGLLVLGLGLFPAPLLVLCQKVLLG